MFGTRLRLIEYLVSFAAVIEACCRRTTLFNKSTANVRSKGVVAYARNVRRVTPVIAGVV